MKANSRYHSALVGLLSVFTGSGIAAATTTTTTNCTTEPGFSVIAEGQTVNLKATCTSISVEDQDTANPLDDVTSSSPYLLKRINWHLGNSTSDLSDTPIDSGSTITLTTPIHIINFTTPISLGSSPSIYFELWGDTDLTGDLAKLSTTPAQVVVEAGTTLGTDDANVGAMNTPVPGGCGTSQGNSANAMPAGAEACSSGKQTLLITTPTAYSWTCASRTSGTDASCYAIKGFAVTASAGEGGSVSPTSQGVQAGATAAVTATPNGGMSVSSISGCGGTAWSGTSSSPVTYTTGAVNASCPVTASFVTTPVNVTGVCGDTSPSLGQPAASCSAGNAGQVSGTTANWTWQCTGSGTGGAATCNAPRKYTVTATDNGDANGDVSPTSVDVQYGQTTTIGATNVTTGYTASFSGCGTSGSSGATSAITGPCTVTASFGQPAANPTSDPGPWAGLWLPPGTTNVFTVDPQGTRGSATYTFLPGCINQRDSSSSGSGCSVQSSVTEGETTVSFGTGKVISVRYKTKASMPGGQLGLTRSDGGSFSWRVSMWISATPGGQPVAGCDGGTSVQPIVYIYPGWCVLQPDTLYYLNVRSDVGGLIKVIEDAADFAW